MTIFKAINKTLLYGTAAILSTAVSSCSTDAGKSGREEGIIEFSTRAMDPSHPLFGFAPDAATLKYKKNKFAIEMSTMGMFNYAIIGDTKEKTLAQTVKFMNFKQACIERGKDLDSDNNDYALSFEETSDTKKIIGLKCYRVKVSKVHEPTVKFDAWYTRELGMENCNALTPYAPIKGILLDYRIKKMGIEMHFLAKSHRQEKVPDHTFKIPATMKVVSKEEMQKFFEDLQ